MTQIEQNLQKLNYQTRLAHLAGYFEGEGCIYFNHNRNNAPLLVIKVASGDKSILEKFAETFGGEIKKTKTSKIAKRQMWRWEQWGQQAQETIKLLSPFFIDVKKELAFLALVPIFNIRGKNISEEEREIRNCVAAQVSALNNRITLQ